MANSDYSMYDTEDQEMPAPKGALDVSVKKLPMTTQFQIGNHNITVINPEYVEVLQRKLTLIENKFKLIEDEMRILKQKSNQHAKDASSIRTQLYRKIDRDQSW